MATREYYTDIDLKLNQIKDVVIDTYDEALPTGTLGQIAFYDGALQIYTGSEWKALATGGDTESLDGRIGALETTVGDSSAGLVKDVADLQSEVETASTGLLARVSAIESSAYATSGIDSTKVGQIATNTTAISTINSSAPMTSGITAAKVTKLDGIAEGAQVNVIESVKLNGTALTVTDKTVNVDLSNDYYTKTQIDGKIGGAFHYKSTVANYAALPTTDVSIGDVYNITESGGTDSHGTAIKAGDNVACSAVSPSITWDVLSGTTDLSAYVQTTAMNTALAGKVDKLGTKPTASTYTKVTINSEGQVTAGANIAASDIPDIAESQVTGLVSDLDAKLDDTQLVTSFQSTPDDTHIASEKLVKDSLDNKVDKVAGKQLSTEDYTTAEKTKLSGIETGAQVNVIETINVNGSALTPTSKAVSIAVPTNNNQLTNGAGYQTSSDVQTAIENNNKNFYTATELDAQFGEASLSFSSGTATVSLANVWLAEVITSTNVVVDCKVTLSASTVTVEINGDAPEGGLKLRYIKKPVATPSS